jgi:hypothetical protein
MKIQVRTADIANITGNTMQSKTPLTDAEAKLPEQFHKHTYIVTADFARSLELKLQETEAKLEVSKQKENSYQMALILAQHRAESAERQRDEAKESAKKWSGWCAKLTTERDENKRMWDGASKRRILAEAERDQLIKVVDELEKYKGIAIYCHGGQLALKAYSLLPHVLAKNNENSAKV